MAKHKIQFTERYYELKDHTGIVIYTPDNISTEYVTFTVDEAVHKNPSLPLAAILDDAVKGKGWEWSPIKYDAEIWLPAQAPRFHRRMGNLKDD